MAGFSINREIRKNLTDDAREFEPVAAEPAGDSDVLLFRVTAQDEVTVGAICVETGAGLDYLTDGTGDVGIENNVKGFELFLGGGS